MTAIEFENISKQYRLGLVSTRTLSHDFKRWYTINILGKDDPYLKIGEVNDRAHRGESEYVWALKDINFKVEQGDVLGIIGKNGAGKSTLLKILSKVTTPSTGTIKARGRIASLLEVGTGFHPEMTGRENIYMNGAIMGMTKAEISRKFDEIVDFSGVERYIDTPAKRYSSGMTVRLGFAIAAHLDPEILVVDEVLAVGDAEFQKKAIGKMQDVSKGEGRTVLFVSHNMGAIASLCNRCVLLENGTVYEDGTTSAVISNYLNRSNDLSTQIIKNIEIANGLFIVNNIEIIQNNKANTTLNQGSPFEISFKVENKTTENTNLEFNIEIKNSEGTAITCFGNEFQKHEISLSPSSTNIIRLSIDELLLKTGNYFASFYFKLNNKTEVYDKYIEDIVRLNIEGPSPLYFTSEKYDWKFFPTRHQHGSVNLKVHKFECIII